MIRVVVDTNVLVSALLTEHGAEAEVLALIVADRLIWCVSEATVAEYDLVLNRSKFQRLERRKIAMALALAKAGEMAIVTTIARRSPHDPDNRFLECAEAAAADFLVTGNTRHFPKSWKATKIVNARQFLEVLASR